MADENKQEEPLDLTTPLSDEEFRKYKEGPETDETPDIAESEGQTAGGTNPEAKPFLLTQRVNADGSELNIERTEFPPPVFEMSDKESDHYERIRDAEDEMTRRKAHAYRFAIEHLGINHRMADSIHSVGAKPNGDLDVIRFGKDADTQLKFSEDGKSTTYKGKAPYTMDIAMMQVQILKEQGHKTMTIEGCKPEQAAMLLAAAKMQGLEVNKVTLLNRFNKTRHRIIWPNAENPNGGAEPINYLEPKSNKEAAMMQNIEQMANEHVENAQVTNAYSQNNAMKEAMPEERRNGFAFAQSGIFSREAREEFQNILNKDSKAAEEFSGIMRGALDNTAKTLGFENAQELAKFLEAHPERAETVRKLTDLEIKGAKHDFAKKAIEKKYNEIRKNKNFVQRLDGQIKTMEEAIKDLEKDIDAKGSENAGEKELKKLLETRDQLEQTIEKRDSLGLKINKLRRDYKSELSNQANPVVLNKIAKVRSLTRLTSEENQELIDAQEVISETTPDARKRNGMLAAIQRFEPLYEKKDVDKLQEALNSGQTDKIEKAVREISMQKAGLIGDTKTIQKMLENIGIEQKPEPNAQQPNPAPQQQRPQQQRPAAGGAKM